jgi:hypothetical protein
MNKRERKKKKTVIIPVAAADIQISLSFNRKFVEA